MGVKDLKQLKVTMPIRIVFAVVKGLQDANPSSSENYKIKVCSDSSGRRRALTNQCQNADKWSMDADEMRKDETDEG